jgi:hypothetical protein
MNKIPGIIVMISMIASCSKPAGQGGTSTIEGTVIVQVIDNQGGVFDEYGAQEADVYLTYGDNEIYDDRMNTHYDGRYKFEYLHKGTYRVYAYTECDTCPSKKQPVETSVEITRNNSLVEAPVIYIQDLPTVN